MAEEVNPLSRVSIIIEFIIKIALVLSRTACPYGRFISAVI